MIENIIGIMRKMDAWEAQKDNTWLKGLTKRPGNVLLDSGFSSKQQVCDLIQAEGIEALKRISGLGDLSRVEIAEWAGVTPEANTKARDRSIDYLERLGYTVIPPESK